MAVVSLPRPRTFSRWRKLAFSSRTLLRALEYEAISGVALSGKVLDIGGDRHSGYHELFRGDIQFDTVNLNSAASPTYQYDLEYPLPIADDSYDHVISLNTFEHIRNDEHAVSEAIRVLAPGGTFHFIVPFLYRVHGSPRDFHRHTHEWWVSLLRASGVYEFRIEPLVWDPLSSGAAIAGKGRIIRALTMLIGMSLLKRPLRWLLQSSAERIKRDEIRERRISDAALGYYVDGSKPRTRPDEKSTPTHRATSGH